MDTPNTMIERRKAWIDAATSGKYTQTRSEFKSKEKDNCFCFTGLACEIYREMTGDGALGLGRRYRFLRLRDRRD